MSAALRGNRRLQRGAQRLARTDANAGTFTHHLRDEALALGDPLDLDRDRVDRPLDLLESLLRRKIRDRRRSWRRSPLPHQAREPDAEGQQYEDGQYPDDWHHDLLVQIE